MVAFLVKKVQTEYSASAIAATATPVFMPNRPTRVRTMAAAPTQTAAAIAKIYFDNI